MVANDMQYVSVDLGAGRRTKQPRLIGSNKYIVHVNDEFTTRHRN